MKAASYISFLIISMLFVASGGRAQTPSPMTSEMDRLSGFAKHQINNQKFDKARSQGMTAQFEEEEQWEIERERNLRSYKKTKRVERIDDEGPEARADAAVKKKYADEYEKSRQAYQAQRSKQETLVREKFGLPTEAQELGLNDNRPRYDYRKRAAFGATPKYGKSASSSSSSGSSGGGSRFGGGGSSPSFPPPPSFDSDFGGGYVPAPTMNSDDFGDVPPPPPPPLFPEQMDEGVSYDFPPPPPPPPPPTFEEGVEY